MIELNPYFFLWLQSFLYNYNVFGSFKSFGYSGLKEHIAGICLFISFYLIPFDKIKNIIIISCIKAITRNTGGIYYLQTIIYYIIKKFKFKYLNQSSFYICFMIYILGYLICIICTKLFRNNRLKYLFYWNK